MKFVTSPGFQNAIPTGNWMYPAVKTPLPAGYDALIVPAISLQYSAKTVAENRSKWTQAWQNAVSR
jgi:thiamine transport system substrate-binding protein